jgi:hypothetical protein
LPRSQPIGLSIKERLIDPDFRREVAKKNYEVVMEK